MSSSESSDITFSIGGMPVLIASPCSGILKYIRATYTAFLSTETPCFELCIGYSNEVSPTDFLSVSADRLDKFSAPDGPSRQPFKGDRPTDIRTGQSPVNSEAGKRPNISQQEDRIIVQRHDFAAVIETDKRCAKAIIRPRTEAMSIESILRVCCSFLAVGNGRLLLHAGGVIRRNKGYLFPGPSGTGKSTIVGMAVQGDIVLSDEMIVVGRQDADWCVSSTPFFGTNEGVNRHLQSKLCAVFLPVKDTRVSIDQVPTREALRKLLVCVVSPGGPPSMNQSILDLCVDLVDSVPFFQLHFRKENSFWKSIDDIPLETTCDDDLIS